MEKTDVLIMECYKCGRDYKKNSMTPFVGKVDGGAGTTMEMAIPLCPACVEEARKLPDVTIL